jgi:nucleoside-diphosphate-sugar epimerase
MHVLITGAAGFIGQLVAKALLSSSEHTVLLTDVIDPPIPSGAKHPENAKTLALDLATSSSELPLSAIDAAYIFHGIMSSGSEANFDLGMRVNVVATHYLLDAIRASKPGMRVIYSSSQAVYGPPFPDVVDEKVMPTPESSYGAEKCICEMLVNEYTRRGFIDGFTLRFPTITVRPGKPTAAASSFVSGIIREPLNGIECVIPIEDRDFVSWICSPKTLTKNLLHALTLPSDALLPHIRQVNMPGYGVTVQEMINALEKVGGKEAVKLVKEKRDEETEKILRSWAVKFDNTLAYSLGYHRDGSFEEAVRDYKESMGS